MDYKHNLTRTKPLKFGQYTLHIVLISLSILCFVLAFAPDNNDQSPDNTAPIRTTLETFSHNRELTSSTPENIVYQMDNVINLPSKNQWQSIEIKAGDTLSSLFQRLGVPPQTLHKMVTSIKREQPNHCKEVEQIQPGQEIQYRLTERGDLESINITLNLTDALHISRRANKPHEFTVQKITNTPEIRIAYGGDLIKNSLALAGRKSGLDNKVIMQLADIFSWDIDFALDVRENDSFRILYEEKYINNKKVDTGAILAAEFVNRGRVYQAIRYTNLDGSIEYYSPEGYSMRQAFSRTPVDFARISSHFNMKRHHPVLHKIRAHKGVDYAAPIGTPVKATGNSKVKFIGQQGGYGNVIILDHGNGYTTLYAHLSRFRAGLRQGHAVKQNEIIAFVGQSGLASGPHLHYEFRINGVHRNPLTVELPKNNTIHESSKEHFGSYAQKLLKLLSNPNRYPILTAQHLEDIEIHG